jgi:glycosyltransferase involved in cell wall biosynthesis
MNHSTEDTPSDEIHLSISLPPSVDTSGDLKEILIWPLCTGKSSIKKQQPLITVIMTNFNCAKYLSLSIASILNQTWKNIELIIIDDCSTEDKEEIEEILGHFKKDTRVQVMKNVRNVGCYISKNIGILVAKGEYITFQDADDFSIETRLEKQYLLCKRENVAMCYAKYSCRTTKLMKIAEITCFAHRDTFIKILGCFDSTRIGADSELRFRAQKSSFKYGIVDEYLYSCLDKWIENFGNRPSSLTQSHETSITSSLRQQYRITYESSRSTKYSLYQKLHFEMMKNILSEKLLNKLFPKEEDVKAVLRDYKLLTV